ncbi:hypothetical protein [Actinomadura sp. WAC 06369]|uniref:hypothetical protein n=1 Tax=Actinomadura sp. WAC 06369 TaxID=2203193 RepID=UPI000F775DA7|nr:hypothetical protein [Actinomadura sp. WAC 06369]RSN61937.1 hypothetical protein DMH08_20320 [Actinomadura sp. WAC 06369]
MAVEVARWDWLYEYDEESSRGFGFGRFVLHADGALLRSHGENSETWREVSWWPGETDPRRAARLLWQRGYELKNGPEPAP